MKFNSFLALFLVLHPPSVHAENVAIPLRKIESAKSLLAEAGKTQDAHSKKMVKVGNACVKGFYSTGELHMSQIKEFHGLISSSMETLDAILSKVKESSTASQLSTVNGGAGAFEAMDVFFSVKLRDLGSLKSDLVDQKAKFQELYDRVKKALPEQVTVRHLTDPRCLVLPKIRFEAEEEAVLANSFPDASLDPQAELNKQNRNGGFGKALNSMDYALWALRTIEGEYRGEQVLVKARLQKMGGH